MMLVPVASSRRGPAPALDYATISSHSAPYFAHVKHFLEDDSEARGRRPWLARLIYFNLLFRGDLLLIHNFMRISRPIFGPSAVSMRYWTLSPGERSMTIRPSASNVRRRALIEPVSPGKTRLNTW